MSPELDQEICQFFEEFEQPGNYDAATVKSRLLDLQIAAHVAGSQLPPAYDVFLKVCSARIMVAWPLMEHCLEDLFNQAYAADPIPA